MPRLPQPGSDNGTWGDILNEFLSQSLKSDGSIQDNAVTSSAIAPNSITNTELASDAVNASIIADGSITEVLLDSALQSKINAPPSAPVTSVAGKTGVVSLTKTDVGLGNVDNTSDAAKPVSTAQQAALDEKLTTTSTADRVYVTASNGDQITRPYGSSATSLSMVYRDSNSRAQFADPDSAQDAATKNYVDIVSANKQATFMTGTVGTANTTAAKTVTLDSPWSSHTPMAGDIFLITFTNGTLVAMPTLSINGSPAINIYATSGSNSATEFVVTSGGIALFQYNGTILQGIAAYTGEITQSTLLASGSGTVGLISGRRAEALLVQEAAATRTLTNKTLTSPRVNQLLDTNGNAVISLNPVASAVNYARIDNAATGGAPALYAAGSDTDVSLSIYSKGAGGVVTRSTTNGIIMRAFGQTNGVNYFDIYNGVANNPPTLRAAGSDTDIGINFVPKGAGTVQANGSEIATVSATQTFTNKTLTSPRIVNGVFGATTGQPIFGVIENTSAVNYIQIHNSATGNALTIGSVGTDANINLNVSPKGTGRVVVTNLYAASPRIGTAVYDVNGNTLLGISAVASAVNNIEIANATTGNPPILRSAGSDTNINMNIQPKGTGAVVVRDGAGTPVLWVQGNTSAANYFNFQNVAAGSSPTIYSSGSDTNINFQIAPKGSGKLQIYSGAGLQPGIQATSADTNVDLTLSGKGTGGVALPNGNALGIYNTADQTTNYERVRHFWSANTYIIAAEQGGTGSARNISLTSGNQSLTLGNISSGTDGAVMSRSATSIASVFTVTTSGAGLNASSGTQAVLKLSPTISQTSTAGYTGLHINVTETTTGSGSKNLILAQVGGVDKFTVDNVGTTRIASGAGLQVYNTPDQTTNYERLHMFWTGNVGYLRTESGGTGTLRALVLTGSNRNLTIGSGLNFYDFNMSTSSTSAISGINLNGAISNSSGATTGLSITPTLTQTGTAGYTAILVNATETTVGTGTKRLLDLQVGGISKFYVNNAGQMELGDYALTSEIAHFKGGSTGMPIMKFSRGSGTTASAAYDFNLAGGGFGIRDTQTGVIAANLFSSSIYAQFFIGQNGSIGNYSAVEAYLSASTHASAAGSNIGGPPLIIQGGGGTGSGTPGDIRLRTASTTTPGNTVHTYNTRLTIKATTGEVTIAYPGNNTGSVVAVDATQTLTNKTWGDNLNMGSHRITSVTDPSNAQDVATKNYVDTNTVTASGAATLTNKTLTNPRINQIVDTNGANILGLYAIGSAVNSFYVTNQAATNWPTFGADGGDANIGITLAPKGNGSVRIYATTGNTPTLDVAGPDSNLDLNLRTQGTGVVKANDVPVATQVVAPPVSATAAGVAGQIAYDANYFYQCIATNTWKRSPLSSW